MKYVWYVQDYNSMQVSEVYTTKKAAFAEAKKFGKGQFHTVVKGEVYHYYTSDDQNDYACNVEKVPVIKATRKS